MTSRHSVSFQSSTVRAIALAHDDLDRVWNVTPGKARRRQPNKPYCGPGSR